MEHGHVIASRPLGELLVERGLLTEYQLEDALDHQLTTGGLLGAILVERGIVTAPVLTALLAEQAGVVWKPLGELLVERGLLSSGELSDALVEQQETGERLGAILVERRVIAGAVLAAILAEQAGSELEREAGFGTGLFAKLARHPAPSGHVGGSIVSQAEREAKASATTLQPTEGGESDPAFEVIRLRSELEREHARVAALEREVAVLRGEGFRGRRASG